jgi:hypothetical protein
MGGGFGHEQRRREWRYRQIDPRVAGEQAPSVPPLRGAGVDRQAGGLTMSVKRRRMARGRRIRTAFGREVSLLGQFLQGELVPAIPGGTLKLARGVTPLSMS